MSKRIIGGFAIAGFVLPLLLLAYYHFSGTVAGEGFVRVCPACIMSMALDNASTVTGIIVWLVICTTNAFLYALPGAGIAFLVNLRKSN